MKKILVLILFFVFLPYCAGAATLLLDTPKDEYYFGDSFTANLSIDIEDACINAIETKITFPKDILSIENFVVGDSLINVWVNLPSEEEIFDANDKGELYIAGGIPGGYCGKIPGDPGQSNLIGKILFRIPGFYVGDRKIENLDIKLVDSKVYINDGLGTEDKIHTNNLTLKLNKTANPEAGDYRRLIENDTKKPEPFVIELQKNENMYQGQYFAIFSTLDKQSGVDHYEILETKTLRTEKTLTEKLLDYFLKPKKAEWKIAKTPYLLEDQSLRSIIKVKAIDRAGNERSVEYIPEEPNNEKVLNFDYLIIGFAVLLLLLVAYIVFKIFRFVYRRFKKKKNSNEEKIN